MKRILITATGGTIGSSFIDGCRRLDVGVAKSTLLKSFAESGSQYAALGNVFFEDSGLELKTLSENMTLDKLFSIVKHIKEHEREGLSGIIVLHGTDTLAFSAAMLSLLCCDTDIPLILVSGNCPPDDENSNAGANFRAAVELICGGLAPNVYAVYRNSNGGMYLHIGSTLLQCADFSEDFLNGANDKVFLLDSNNELSAEAVEICRNIFENRRSDIIGEISDIQCLSKEALMLMPYVGMDYGKLKLDGVGGIVHRTYHSGTVCVDGESFSVTDFGKRCAEQGIPLYIAPCKLDEKQYESTYKAAKGGIIPLNMTSEFAYCKLVLGLSIGLLDDRLNNFMRTEINSEFIS